MTARTLASYWGFFIIGTITILLVVLLCCRIILSFSEKETPHMVHRAPTPYRRKRTGKRQSPPNPPPTPELIRMSDYKRIMDYNDSIALPV